MNTPLHRCCQFSQGCDLIGLPTPGGLSRRQRGRAHAVVFASTLRQTHQEAKRREHRLTVVRTRRARSDSSLGAGALDVTPMMGSERQGWVRVHRQTSCAALCAHVRRRPPSPPGGADWSEGGGEFLCAVVFGRLVSRKKEGAGEEGWQLRTSVS